MSRFSKRQKEQALVALAAVFFIALSLYSYFRIYTPAKDANENALSTMTNERNVLFALEKQQAKIETSATSSSRPLQQKVPVKPLDDLILLQVNKAEVKSGTIVEEVNFEREALVIDPPSEEAGPMQSVVTEVKLHAGNYAQLDRFIEEIESMERIFIVDALEFEVPEELQTVLEDEDRTLKLAVRFHALYRPDLTDLADEAPKVDPPRPAEKDDPTPFNSSAGIGEGNED